MTNQDYKTIDLKDIYDRPLPTEPHATVTKEVLDKTAISPYQNYCDGFSSPGAKGLGYVNLLKVETGAVRKTNDMVLDGIVAYDRAETTGSNIGQINMITASSFCGLAGQIWGYDLAKHEDIGKGRVITAAKQWDGSMLYAYDAAPLLNAAERLLGTVDKPRFPLIPGAHTICANKGALGYRPEDRDPNPEKSDETYAVWSYISISIAKNRDVDANLFVEDAGLWTIDDPLKNPDQLLNFLKSHVSDVHQCNVKCGADSKVLFSESYIGYAYRILKPGEVGMAITVGPYVTMAQQAVPNGDFKRLSYLTLKEWEDEVPIK